VSSLPQILLLDDDVSVHRAVEFRLRGFAQLSSCADADAALELARTRVFDAALIDVNLGEGVSGISVLALLKGIDPDLAALIFTAHSDYATALEAFRVHAFDFLPKSLREDGQLRVKLDQAVARTRFLRAQSRQANDALSLRSALQRETVRSELEISSGDIQRGLLAESLRDCTALLGRVEVMNLHLEQRAARSAELHDLARAGQETLTELQAYVEKLRDFFAAPDRVAESINGVIGRAGNILRDELPVTCAVRVAPLEPDEATVAEGRALLRAIVLLGQMAAGRAEDAVVAVKARPVLSPQGELLALREAPGARVLQIAEYRPEGARGLAIDIAGPGRNLDAAGITALMMPGAGGAGAAAAWSVLAMLARIPAALVSAPNGSGGVRFTILFGR
jgi:ActR/RegA family two-component response regulator